MRLLGFLLILANPCSGGTIIQIKDFICGCEYCDTVDTGEPLDISTHMMLCHSWRGSISKTIEIMNRTKKPKLKDRNETKANKTERNNQIANQNRPNKETHEWKQDDTGDWEFSGKNNLLNKDGWVYREEAGWFWTFNNKMFLYSEHYGWLYNYTFHRRRVFYWYDRRLWILPNKLPKPQK
jgi:hypothetical protein